MLMRPYTCRTAPATDRLASVIVPTWNRKERLARTLGSVLHSSWRPLEVVVVDDASTARMDRFVATRRGLHEAAPDFLVRYVRLAENQGPPVARNTGPRISTGAFVQFLDSDDLLEERKIELQAALLFEHRDLDYVYGRTDQVAEDGRRLDRIGTPLDPDRFAGNIPQHNGHVSGARFRRELCLQAGPWSEDLGSSEDWEYAARIKAATQRAAYLEEAVSFYVVHGNDQIIRSPCRRRFDRRRMASGVVLDILRHRWLHDRRALAFLARALIANALDGLGVGGRAAMREDLRAARKRGRSLIRPCAWILNAGSHFLPGGVLRAPLRFARMYRQARAGSRRTIGRPRRLGASRRPAVEGGPRRASRGRA